MPHRKCCFAFILFAVLSAAIAAAGMPSRASGAETLNFPPSDFNILSAETGKTVGRAHYTVDRVTGGIVLHGDNRYLDGTHDVEEDRLGIAQDRPLPVLVDFRHSFYRPDGSLESEGRLDVPSGLASCARFRTGHETTKNEKFEFPGDTYAGASILIPIQDFLQRTGGKGDLKLHVFNCAPTPRLLSVEVEPEPATQQWPHYPGPLQKIDVNPDFGFWNFVLRPFIPKLAAWFDPESRWLFVGARLQRYYRGPNIILVRASQADDSNPSSGARAPSVAGSPPP